MVSDLRKISWLAIALIVALRISIGWHLFYEGMWKLSTQKSASPWTAEGYLKNATGPLRTTFRNMTGDPNDLKWLDYDLMSAKWDAWRDRFVAHYKIEREKVDELLDGDDADFVVSFSKLPPDMTVEELAKSAGVMKDAIKYDAEGKKLIVDRKLHLTPAEQTKLIDLVKAPQDELRKQLKDAQTDEQKKALNDNIKAYDPLIKAINDVAKKSSKLSYRERLIGTIRGNNERVGIVLKGKSDGEPDMVVSVGDVEVYKDLIERYEASYAKAKEQFQWDHLERQWKELQEKRRSLVGPVQALEKELMEDANKLLSAEQLMMGPPPQPVTEMSQINARTMWGLTIIGLLLMVGLLTRLSAIGGAGLLTLFYMAMPPWPGVQEIPSIEHNLIVNKVFVEMIALLAIAALPSGKWFGIDAIFAALFRRRSPNGK